MAISLSADLMVVRTKEALKFVDPKTSSILQSVNCEASAFLSVHGYMLASSSKNVLSAFDLAGNELWKQHLGGEAQVLSIHHCNGFHLFVFRNKEIRIFSQVSETKVVLDLFCTSLVLSRQHKQYLAFVDDIQHNIHIYLIEDLLSELAKPFRTLTGHKARLNDLVLGPFVASASANGTVLVHALGHGQVVYQTSLDSEPKSIEMDLDYLYLGCLNRSIYQIKYNPKSAHFTMQPLQQEQPRKVLIGHLAEVVQLRLLHDEGRRTLVSLSLDGQILFWSLEQNTLQKKILTLNAQAVELIRRPEEFRQQTDEQIFFKSKRATQIKPLKKAKYTPNQQVLTKRRVWKPKLEFRFQKPQNCAQGDDPQLQELIEENQRLKELLHSVI